MPADVVPLFPLNAAASSSTYGIEPPLLDGRFPALQLWGGQRAKELEYRSRYFTCSQHDHKVFDFNGRMVKPAKHASQPLIGGAVPNFYVPLDQRRPSAPYRLGRTITLRFTGMVFGQGRWPNVISDDPDTQDFCETLVKETALHEKLIRARNFGGSTGSVGLSWWFDDGVPKVRVHQSRHVTIHEWEDEDAMIPAHVIELYQYAKDEYNEARKAYVKTWYWSRRDWTRTADVVFRPQRVTSAQKNPEVWHIDEDKTTEHGDGFCHFVWIENLPNDDDVASVDGQPDYAELYEQLDTLDILNSTHVKGVTCNLDPTLTTTLHAEDFADAAIRKGSDNALALGPGGSAQYLTLGSDVITGGQTAINGQRDQILETAECVIPDPDELMAAGTSSVALRVMYAPMLNKCDLLRSAYGARGIQRLLEQMLKCARSFMPDIDETDPEKRYVYEPEIDDDGLPVIDMATGQPKLAPVEYKLKLPPRIEKVELEDAEGNPIGNHEVHEVERNPGKGRISLEWPDYFPKTPTDRQAEAMALVTAAGSKPVLSQQSAVEQWALSSERDGQEEFERIRKEQQKEREAQAALQAGMFPGTGMLVPPTSEPAPPVTPEADGSSTE